MKRIICIALASVLLLGITACSNKYDSFQQAVDKFVEYYDKVNNTDDALSKDIYLKNAERALEDISELYGELEQSDMANKYLDKHISVEAFNEVYEYNQSSTELSVPKIGEELIRHFGK